MTCCFSGQSQNRVPVTVRKQHGRALQGPRPLSPQTRTESVHGVSPVCPRTRSPLFRNMALQAGGQGLSFHLLCQTFSGDISSTSWTKSRRHPWQPPSLGKPVVEEFSAVHEALFHTVASLRHFGDVQSFVCFYCCTFLFSGASVSPQREARPEDEPSARCPALRFSFGLSGKTEKPNKQTNETLRSSIWHRVTHIQEKERKQLVWLSSCGPHSLLSGRFAGRLPGAKNVSATKAVAGSTRDKHVYLHGPQCGETGRESEASKIYSLSGTLRATKNSTAEGRTGESERWR